MQIPSMPFKILALAPFTSENAPWSQHPLQVNKSNLDGVINDLGPSCRVPVPRNLCADGELEITCKQFKDFHPDGMVQSNGFLKNLLDARDFVEEGQKQGLSPEQIGTGLVKWPNLPPIRISAEKTAPKKASSRAVDDILEMVALPEQNRGASRETTGIIGQIDACLREALVHVFSFETFRNLEASWQGLKCLVDQEKEDGNVAFQIVPVSLETLEETLDHVTMGLVGDLPSLVIVDLPFNNTPRSIECLEKVAQFAETLLCPAVCWVTHEFLHLDSWDDLHKLSFLPHYLDEQPFAKWRSLANTSSARWLAVTCNRFLARYPYGPDNKPRRVNYQESLPLWVSPAWAIAALVAQSHAKTGWPTRFTDWQHIRLDNLPLDTGEPNKPIATEVAIPENRIDQFARAGITPLVGYRNKDIAFVLEEATVGKGSLSYQMFLGRITHFVLWCKDNIGKDLPPKELEGTVTKALSLLWEKTGDAAPKSLVVSVSDPDGEGRLLVKISVAPSRHVLPSGEKAELEFYW